MNTLTEIETVVDRLPLAEQEELLRHLETRLRGRRGGETAMPREDWMRRLDALRTAVGSGALTSSSEQILTELREE